MDLLKEGAKKFGIYLTSNQLQKFFIYLKELKVWNKRFNLTAIKDDKQIVIKHFLDSLSLRLVMKNYPRNLVDIGPGAGFPSIPLKIAFPDIKCSLIESSSKKVDFLLYLKERLNLKQIEIIKERAERIARGEKRESFECAVARAVARLNVLLEYSLPFVKTGGYFIAQKGPDTREIKTAQNALLVLGGELAKIRHLELPFSEESRCLILIQKVKSTPLKYPRRPGIPKKRPL